MAGHSNPDENCHFVLPVSQLAKILPCTSAMDGREIPPNMTDTGLVVSTWLVVHSAEHDASRLCATFAVNLLCLLI